jgi:hypothetical protein
VNTPTKIGLASGAFVAALFAIIFALGTFEPEDLLVAGQTGPSVAVITEDFGPPTNPRPGYDGQQVYALARALPDLEAAEPNLDAPAYRASRILQSALAAPAPNGVPLVLALLFLGIVGAALAAGAIADLAERHGRDPRIGFLALPCLAMPLLITTNESLAFGLAFLAIALLDRERLWPAVIVGVLAGLTKESALVALAAAALGAWRTQRWRVVPFVVVPAAAYVGWFAIARQILPGRQPDRVDLLAMRHMSFTAILFVLVVMGLGLAGAWAWRDVPVLWPVSLAFGVWPLFFTTDSLDWLALVRIVAPALVLGVTGLAGEWLRRRKAVAAA